MNAKIQTLLPNPALKWLKQFSPYDKRFISSPLFAYEGRRLKWGRNPADLMQHSWRWFAWVVALGVGGWLLFLLAVELLSEDPLAAIFWALQSLFWFSFLDKFLLDTTGILSGLDSINKDITEGRWELICLSNISTYEVLKAKHTVIQVQMWRLGVRIAAFRLLLLLLSFFSLVILPLFEERNRYFMMTQDYMAVVLMLPALLVFCCIYVLEPLLRLRVLAAAGLAISSAKREPAMALLSAFGAMVGIWMTQILAGVVSFFMLWMLSGMFFSVISSAVAAFFYMVAVGFVIYALYEALVRNWLTRAHRRLIERGGAP